MHLVRQSTVATKLSPFSLRIRWVLILVLFTKVRYCSLYFHGFLYYVLKNSKFPSVVHDTFLLTSAI